MRNNNLLAAIYSQNHSIVCININNIDIFLDSVIRFGEFESSQNDQNNKPRIF